MCTITTEATQTYDLAIDRLVRYHPDVVPLTTELVAEQPEFAMGHVLASYLSLTSTDVPDLPGARASAAELARPVAHRARESARRRDRALARR